MSGLFDFWRKSEAPRTPSLPPPDVDLYDILGVSPTASENEIRSNFRELSSKFHPDRNPGDQVAANRYAEITEAYTILSDPTQRGAYDRLRKPPGKSSKEIKSLILPAKKGKAAEAPSAMVPTKWIEPKWERVFGSPTEKRKSFSDIFKKQPPLETTVLPSETPFPRRRSEIEIPTQNDLYNLIQHWPLDFIWEVARNERPTTGFKQAGAVAIDAVAGLGGQPVEYDLAELFSMSRGQIEGFIRQNGREAAFEQVFFPVLESATSVLNELKPRDLPGQFFLDWSPDRRMIEIIYVEEVGRRPWK